MAVVFQLKENAINANTSFVNRHSLVLFFVLAYALSWGNVVLAMTLPNVPFLFPFGPLLAALVMAGLTGGLKDLVSGCLRWRVGLQWYAAALLAGPAIGLVAVYPASCLARLPSRRLCPAPIFSQPFAAGQYASPEGAGSRVARAARRVRASRRCAIPGRSFAFGGGDQLGVLQHTGGALLVILCRSVANSVGIFFSPMFSGPDLVTYRWLLAGVTWVAAVVVVLASGPTLQRRPTSRLEAAYVDQTPMSA